MKIASNATLAILAGGSSLRANLYAFTLTTGETDYFTDGQTPITVAIATSASTFGPSNTYKCGFVITRGSMPQATGVDSQDMQLTFAPAWDNPGGPPTIAGYSIQQAARLGLLDNATVSFSKFFGAMPVPPAQLDTSPGAVAWFLGAVQEIQLGRFSVEMKISSNLLVLTQTQMPRCLYQAGCVHNLYDSGCALSKSAWTLAGSVASIPSGAGVVTNANFNTNLTNADHYFELGVMAFTSGLNKGFSATVKTYLHASGNLQLMVPFPATVSVGDAFTIYPGCDKVQSTCSGKFNNLMHFKATPYVPVPETLYDGGTANPPAPPPLPATQSPAGTTPGNIVSGGIAPSTKGWLGGV
jgi:hypothetical protein